MTAEDTNGGLNNTYVFMGFYYFMTFASLAVHLWMFARGLSLDGPWWGFLYLISFIFAELYWCYRTVSETGINFFAIACGVSASWWVVLLIFRNKLSERLVRVADE